MKNKPVAKQRREDILDVATKVFSRKGYRLTDVQEIADILNIGKGTIYRYFNSKEKLFNSIIERGINKQVVELNKTIPKINDPIQKLCIITRSHIDFVINNMDIVELIIQERSEFKEHFKKQYLKNHQRHLKIIEEIVDEGIKSGQIGTINPKVLANILFDLYHGVLFTAYLGATKNMLKQKGQYIIDVFLKNITVQKTT